MIALLDIERSRRPRPSRREWHAHHPKHLAISGIGIFPQSEFDPFLLGRGLADICAEDPVPKREDRAEIGVSLVNYDRVMDSMHVGGNKNRAGERGNGLRQSDISMMEAYDAAGH